MTASTPDSPEGIATADAWISAMLTGLPADQAAALTALRARIEAAAPEATPGISYAMAAYRYHGRPLVSYAAFKDHCSFFPMGPDVVEPYREALDGFLMAKGTIHFWPDRPLPDGTVEGIVRARMAFIDAKRGTSGARAGSAAAR